jgi:PKD repeat protein
MLPGRRFALAAVAGLAMLACSEPAAAADGPIVTATVYKSGGGVTTDAVSLAGLQNGQQECPQYSGESLGELGRQGPVTIQLVPSGPDTGTWSMATILGCLQTPIPVGAVTGITVLNDTSPEVSPGSELTPADLATPSDFATPSESPVIQDTGTSVQYDRPSRGSTDDDYSDEVVESPPLMIEVFEGPTLDVSVNASPATVSAGATVSFTATVTGADGSPLSYTWDFGDGTPDATAGNPQHPFSATGTYDATVEVTDAAGAVGQATVPITVDSAQGQPPPKSGTTPRSGNGTHPKSNSPTGAVQSGGALPGAGAGGRTPATGGTSQTANPASTSNGASNSGPSAANTNTSANPNTTANTSTSANTNTTATAGTATHTGTSRSPGRARTARAPHSPAPVRGPRVHRMISSLAGTPVDGRLISDVTPLLAGASPLVHAIPASDATAPAVRRAVQASALPVIGAAVAVVLLFTLGAGRELRWRRGWQRLRFGS